jgi:hypothetical protein
MGRLSSGGIRHVSRSIEADLIACSFHTRSTNTLGQPH